jgi:Lsr2
MVAARSKNHRIAPYGIVNSFGLGISLASEIGCSVRRADSMAQKVQVLLVDDLDGSEATETVAFGLDGATYEIDLSTGNAGKLRKELAHYVEHARKASAQARRRRTRTGPGRERSAQIRSWAKQRGYKVNERGRIPANIVAEYEAAH